MSERPAVFLHVATIGRYQEVLDGLLSALASSRLASRLAHIGVHVVGDGPVAPAVSHPALRVHRESDDVTRYEHPTLAAMKHHALAHPGTPVLYLNCLGGRYQGAAYENRAEWRRMLCFLLIERADDCLARLRVHDVCGVEWSAAPLPHMTSNNWWARADHLARLPDEAACVDALRLSDLASYGAHWSEPEVRRRHAAEFWIGMRDEVRPSSLLALADTGLPLSQYGSVPWWELKGIRWERWARQNAGAVACRGEPRKGDDGDPERPDRPYQPSRLQLAYRLNRWRRAWTARRRGRRAVETSARKGRSA